MGITLYGIPGPGHPTLQIRDVTHREQAALATAFQDFEALVGVLSLLGLLLRLTLSLTISMLSLEASLSF